MSTSGISSSSVSNYNNLSLHNNLRHSQLEFRQLGQDLQSGNTSAAQQDLLTLQQLGTQSSSTSTSASTNPIAQEFNQLAQDLQSDNLSAAQQDYSKIQQDAPSQAAQGHPHHHHHGGGSSEISQLFSQLGQDLQSDNLSSAQQAYSTLQQDQQFGLGTGTSSGQSSSQSSSNTLPVTA